MKIKKIIISLFLSLLIMTTFATNNMVAFAATTIVSGTILSTEH